MAPWYAYIPAVLFALVIPMAAAVQMARDSDHPGVAGLITFVAVLAVELGVSAIPFGLGRP